MTPHCLYRDSLTLIMSKITAVFLIAAATTIFMVTIYQKQQKHYATKPGYFRGYNADCNVCNCIGRSRGVCKLVTSCFLIKRKLGFFTVLIAMDLSKVYTVKGIQGIIKKCFKQKTKTFFDNSEDIFERY